VQKKKQDIKLETMATKIKSIKDIKKSKGETR